VECRNCGREHADDRLDRHRWCTACRAEVVRRATRVGRLVGFVSAFLLMLWVFFAISASPRFLMAWLALVVATYFFVYKLTQRVAFEVIRGRGVPPPE
jgi:hypothetical protein